MVDRLTKHLATNIQLQFDNNHRCIEELIKDSEHADEIRRLIFANYALAVDPPLPATEQVDRHKLLVEFGKEQSRIIQLLGFLEGCAESINNFSEELAEHSEQQDRLFSQAISDCNRKEHHQ